MENARSDRLFDDEFAGKFVSAAGSGVTPDAAAVPPGASEFLAIRTRFFDDEARAACAAGVRQVVLLGAGLDCRAFRLEWPRSLRLFELDLPEMLGFKESVLASIGALARCVRVVVPADLHGQWAKVLTAAGFDPGTATGWLAEGVLPYLDHAASDRLLATVAGLSAPGSRVTVDHLDATAAERPAVRATSEVVRRMGAQLMPTVDSPADWLIEHGWEARLFRVPDLGEHYGRPLPAGVDMVASNATVLVTANR